MRNSAPHFPLFVGEVLCAFLVLHSANPAQHFIAFVGAALAPPVVSSLAILTNFAKAIEP